MSEITLLEDQIYSLVDEAREIDRAFVEFVSLVNVAKVRSLRRKTVLDSALEELDGEKRPDYYDDWGWTPNREQEELKRSILRRYEAWYNAGSVLVQQHLPDRSDDFTARYAYVRDVLACGNTLPHPAGKRFDEGFRTEQHRRLVESFDRQVALLHSVPDVVRAKALSLRRLVASGIINSELDRAESLVGGKGRVSAGSLKAACIIASVALERQLKLVADEYNSRRGAERDAIEYADGDGILELAGKLGAVGLLESTELETFKRLSATRDVCVQAHGSRGVRKSEVVYLVERAREFVNLKFFE
ncbi:MAG: hypothetical protein SVP26_08485 [Chloroflexota bacterium]|nr:hypothetical protein [Chloroflexota bacterium]